MKAKIALLLVFVLSSCGGTIEKTVYEITLPTGDVATIEYVNCHQVNNDGMFDKDESPYMTIFCSNGIGEDEYTLLATGFREKP